MSANKPNKPAFQGVEIDLMDRRLEAQAADKGIPTLMASKVGSEEAVTAVAAARPPKPPLKVRRAGPVVESTPRARMKTLNIEVPDYAWIEIKTRAAQKMVSVRHVLMSALRASGIEIKDADMIEDGRRLRGAGGGEDIGN